MRVPRALPLHAPAQAEEKEPEVFTLGNVKYACAVASRDESEQALFEQYMSMRNADYTAIGRRVRINRGKHYGTVGVVVSQVDHTSYLIGLAGAGADGWGGGGRADRDGIGRKRCVHLTMHDFNWAE